MIEQVCAAMVTFCKKDANVTLFEVVKIRNALSNAVKLCVASHGNNFWTNQNNFICSQT